MIFLKLLVVVPFLFVIVRRVIRIMASEDNAAFQQRLRGLLAPVVLLVAVLVVMSGVGTVDSGHRGIVVRMGAVKGRILDEGLYVVTPVIERVVEMSVQIEASPLEASAASKDLQDVMTVVTPNWHVDPESVAMVYQRLRHEYGPRIVKPAVQEAVKATTAKYNAEELITKRSEVSDAIAVALGDRLAPFGLRLDAMSITEFSFSEAFTNAIEAKVTAVQRAMEAQNKLKQVEYEAQQRVASAQAEAEAIRIQAEAITKQGGGDYVKLKAVEKWNGTMPTFIAGDGNMPFLMNVGK